MATATKPKAKAGPKRLTRAQAADLIRPLLNAEEPQSEASLSRQLGLAVHSGNIVPDALAILASLREAKRVPAANGRTGWVTFDSEHEAELVVPQHIEFKQAERVDFSRLFLDKTYQRPLTNLWKEIVKNFDPILFDPLILSDRGKDGLAIVDGQSRWEAAHNRLGIIDGPGIVHRSLTVAQEADLFYRLQRGRRGMVAWHAFRARLRAGHPIAVQVNTLVESVGFELGDGVSQIKAVGALVKTFTTDQFLLGRLLTVYSEAWPDEVPTGLHINGMHFFFRHYPVPTDEKEKRARRGKKHEPAPIDDERLVRRLKVVGFDGLDRRRSAARELGKGSPEYFMAMAIQTAYHSETKR